MIVIGIRMWFIEQRHIIYVLQWHRGILVILDYVKPLSRKRFL